jgi:hypothetical protein
MNSYFYSGQTRRFLQQFIRILSNFQVSMGNDDTGNATLMTVPIYYGDSSRQVATILRNNSENSLASVPAMSVYISGWRYDQKRMQEPFFVSKMNLRYRDVDENGQLTSTVGDAVTVERLMPVPYNLTIKVDIWTSNIEQKLQLLEQIAVLFNPSLEIQSTDNYVDWSSLTYVTLTDTNFTSRTVPVGTEDPLDIASLTFELPVWFSAPAKVKNMGVIQKIITSLWDSVGTINQSEGTFDINASTLMARQVYTLFNFNLLYIGNTIKLVNSTAQQGFSAGATIQEQGYSWALALKNYGQLVNGISQVRLDQGDITIVGTVAYHPTDPEMLLFTPIADTMPANNLDPVNAIIDPANVAVDSTLLNPVAGTRYLILNDIGSAGDDEGPALWNRTGFPTLVAQTNDIIRYTGTHWTLDFDSSTTSSVKYLTNLRTGIQYKWKDQQWTKAVEGRYGAGAWSFVP